jgi:hypothetical protein
MLFLKYDENVMYVRVSRAHDPSFAAARLSFRPNHSAGEPLFLEKRVAATR